jgi:hypothetical protein
MIYSSPLHRKLALPQNSQILRLLNGQLHLPIAWFGENLKMQPELNIQKVLKQQD